jgi:cytochrome c oxidase subunit II
MRQRARLIPNILLLIPALLLGACGGNGPTGAPETSGESLYAEKSCVSCHTVDGSASVGPTWKGLYLSTVELEDGTTVTADEAYLRESILRPSAKTVEGYSPGFMETVIKPDSLSESEVDALVEYIKSLK